MSKPVAIAAVTETLRSLIAAEGVVGGVSALPPDQAASPGTRTVNIFLYHLGINSALRNQEFPWQGRGGGDAQQHPPPFALPLQLHYLLTAFADDDIQAHEALGHAMRVLHDHAQLSEGEIRAAALAAGLDSDLHVQPEKVKVTLQPISVDEMTKIWTSFQSPYRLSVAYEVSVVLIDSGRPSVSPLPVLRRGKQDRGVSAQAGSIAPLITALRRDDGAGVFNSGFVGDKIVIEGHNFQPGCRVLLRRMLDQNDQGKLLVPLEATGEKLVIELAAAAIPAAGPFGLCVVIPDPVNPPVGPTLDGWWRSNQVGFGVAPKITPPLAVAPQIDGSVIVTASTVPPVLPGQRAILLLDGRETSATVDITNPGAPEFTFANLAPGTYGTRLRVDGVDLPGIIRDGDGLLAFAPGEELTIP